MSSILKALRKLEEEKAASRDGGVDIGRDILRFSGRRRKTLPALWPVAIVAALGAAGWGGYRLSRPPAPAAAEPEVAVPAPVSHPSAAAEAIVAPVPSPARSKSAEPPVVEEVLGSDRPASHPAPPPTARAVRPLPAPAPSIVAKPPAPAVTPPEGAAFVLSAISYHEDPDARLAVINDLPVMIGSAIENAVVSDILADRVRLTRSGSSFEIRLHR